MDMGSRTVNILYNCLKIALWLLMSDFYSCWMLRCFHFAKVYFFSAFLNNIFYWSIYLICNAVLALGTQQDDPMYIHIHIYMPVYIYIHIFYFRFLSKNVSLLICTIFCDSLKNACDSKSHGPESKSPDTIHFYLWFWSSFSIYHK